MICKGCGNDCGVVEVDFGVGFTEYWGAPGWDSRIALVSQCCEADWVDERGLDEPAEYIGELDMEMSER